MKKFITSLLVAAVLTAGLVTVSGGTAANAATKVYPGTVTVHQKVTKPAKKTLKKGKKGTIKIKLTAGTGKPVGKVKITVTGPKGYKHSYTKTLKAGKTLSFKLAKFAKKGTYKIKITFTAKAKSVFKSYKNKSAGSFKVK